MCKLLQPSFCYFSCNWLAFKFFIQFFILNSVWVLLYNDSTQLFSVKYIWFLLFLFCHSPGFILIKHYWDCKFVIKVYFNFLLYFVVFIQIFCIYSCLLLVVVFYVKYLLCRLTKVPTFVYFSPYFCVIITFFNAFYVFSL